MATQITRFGKDIWQVIGSNLTLRELLALRQTCHAMNAVVKKMNERWYKAYQWLLIRLGNTSKVKSSVRVHKGPVNVGCISNDHPDLRCIWNDVDLTGHKLQQGRLRILSNGFCLEQCENKTHWSVNYPESEGAIPLGKHYLKYRVYLFYYLIECWRHFSQKHRHLLVGFRIKAANLEQEKLGLESSWRRVQTELEEAKRLTSVEAAKYIGNDIFDQVAAINRYQGV